MTNDTFTPEPDPVATYGPPPRSPVVTAPRLSGRQALGWGIVGFAVAAVLIAGWLATVLHWSSAQRPATLIGLAGFGLSVRLIGYSRRLTMPSLIGGGAVAFLAFNVWILVEFYRNFTF